MTNELHFYQHQAINWLKDHDRGMLFGDPGIGKTAIALHALAQADALPALIVAPLTVCHNVWQAEDEAWDFGFNIHVWHGDRRWFDLSSVDIVLTNPENLLHAFNHIKRWGIRTLILDEQTLFKNPGSNRSKHMRKAAHKFERAWGLTGTPTPRSLENLWAQTMALGLEEVFNERSFTRWQRTHFYPTDFNQRVWEILPTHDTLLYDMVRPYACRLRAEDCLVMPELVRKTHAFRMRDEESLKAYRYAERYNMIPEITDEPMTEAVLVNRLCQFTTGAVYRNAEAGDYIVVDDTKLSELVAWLVEAELPQLVPYRFEHEQRRLIEELHHHAPHKLTYTINGKTSVASTNRGIELWNAGEIDILLAQPQCVGHGVNLQRGPCRDVVFSTPIYDYELYDQVLRRVYRQGVAHDVTVHQFALLDTIDEVALGALLAKEQTQNEFLASIGEPQPSLELMLQ